MNKQQSGEMLRKIEVKESFEPIEHKGSWVAYYMYSTGNIVGRIHYLSEEACQAQIDEVLAEWLGNHKTSPENNWRFEHPQGRRFTKDLITIFPMPVGDQ